MVQEKEELSVQGVFIAVGIQPETKAFEGIVDMEQGYIKAEEEGITSALGFSQQEMQEPRNYGRSLQQRQMELMQ